MSDERVVKGIVENWSSIQTTKGTGVMVHLKLLDYEEKYTFFDESEESLRGTLLDKVPLGSTISFSQFMGKNGFWNFKKESLEIIYIGNGSIPRSGVEEPPKTWSPDSKIIRQNSGTQANTWLNTLEKRGLLKGLSKEQIEKEFFRFAKKFDNWVNNYDQ